MQFFKAVVVLFAVALGAYAAPVPEPNPVADPAPAAEPSCPRNGGGMC